MCAHVKFYHTKLSAIYGQYIDDKLYDICFHLKLYAKKYLHTSID